MDALYHLGLDGLLFELNEALPQMGNELVGQLANFSEFWVTGQGAQPQIGEGDGRQVDHAIGILGEEVVKGLWAKGANYQWLDRRNLLIKV